MTRLAKTWQTLARHLTRHVRKLKRHGKNTRQAITSQDKTWKDYMAKSWKDLTRLDVERPDYIWHGVTRRKKTCRCPMMRIMTGHGDTWRELTRLLTRRAAERLGATPQDSTGHELARTDKIQQRNGRPGNSSQALTRLGKTGLTWTRKAFARRGKTRLDFPGIDETWEDLPRRRATQTSHFATISRLSIPTPGACI